MPRYSPLWLGFNHPLRRSRQNTRRIAPAGNSSREFGKESSYAFGIDSWTREWFLFDGAALPVVGGMIELADQCCGDKALSGARAGAERNLAGNSRTKEIIEGCQKPLNPK
jgi:hypothetical protein